MEDSRGQGGSITLDAEEYSQQEVSSEALEETILGLAVCPIQPGL